MTEDPEAKLLVALLGATQALSAALEEPLRPFALGLADYEVLYRLAEAAQNEKPGVAMQILADQGLLTQSGLTRLLDRLERRGLIERRASSDDQRAKVCALTAAGHRLFDQADPAFCDRLKQEVKVRAKLTKKEMLALVALLRRFGGA